MTPRRAALAAAVAALVAAVVLVIAALGHGRPQVYSLRAPSQVPATTVAPHDRACEGPVSARPDRVGAVRLWGGAVGGSTLVRVMVEGAGNNPLASGTLRASPTPAAHDVAVGPVVPSRTALTVCVDNIGSHPFTLLGSSIIDPSIVLTSAGKHVTAQFSLALLGTPTSGLSDLPRIFARASLFKPAWVGAWTFWLLLAGLALAFAMVAGAVASALREDVSQSSRSGE